MSRAQKSSNFSAPAAFAVQLLLTAAAAAAAPSIDKIDLFTAGEGAYKLYHIPGIVVTSKGTVLAWCEARKNGGDWDDIHILLRRSIDDGRTWSDPKNIVNVPGSKAKNPFALRLKSVNPGSVTYNNPVLIADRDGTVHMLFCLEYMRCFYQRSTDDGQTWSDPTEITSIFEAFRSEYDWKVLATGPNHCIQLKSGRLIVPVWLSTGTGGNAHRPSVTATIYSDDGGRTWRAGDIAVPCTDEWINPNETVAIELADGRVMLNVRNESKHHRRLVTISPDGATNWSTARFDETLLEPICMAGLVRYSTAQGGGKNRILFCNPHNLERADQKAEPGKSRDRRNLSVKISYDEGATWAVNKTIEKDWSAYSDIAVTPTGAILCFCGRGAKSNFAGDRLTLARFNLEWLTDGQDSGPPVIAQTPQQQRDTALAAPKGLKTKLTPGYSIPTVDISAEAHRQVVVDRESGQYLGHPSTVLLEDGKTILIAYPKGHGRGALVYKRSTDGGRTWSERLPTPKSWESSLEVPTLHRVIDAAGKKRIIMFSGLYPIRMAVTEDDGARWSELEPIGDFGGVVTMATVLGLATPGHYLAFFHDDGRFIRGGQESRLLVKGPHSEHVSPAAKPWRFWVYTTLSKDGGLTWSVPAPIAMLPGASLCEPGALRSPDGKQIAVLLRENSRKYNSFVIFSEDEGLSWTEPRELPASLTGDRHTAKYGPDGRLFISFRDTTHVSPTKGDWVGWVGTYDDIVKNREGQYRVRIMDNTKGADCCYPGVELLPEGTFVTTTYGHWTTGEQPYIVSVRFQLSELDAKLAK